MSRLSKVLWAAASLAAIGASSAAYATKVEPRSVRLRQYQVGLPWLPAELEGLKIGFGTDFHVNGPGFGTEMTAKAFEILRQYQPELLLLGGDYYDKSHWTSEGSVAFDQLAEFKHVYGIFGNHDHRRSGIGVQRLAEKLGERGVCILQNNSVSHRIRGREVTISGTDDPYTRRDNMEATLAGRKHVLVLLAHAPVLDTLPIGAASLVLCGHTHAGQVRLSPFKKLTPLDSTWWLDRFMGRPLSRYQRGFHWVRGNLLYVANGIGTTRLPLRLLAPPEIILFHLSHIEPHPDQPCDSPMRYVQDISQNHARIKIDAAAITQGRGL